MNNLYEHIQNAKKEALKRGFKANTIVIDTDLAFTNGFDIATETVYGTLVEHVPPTFAGLNVVYEKNLKDMGFNFIICETNLNTLAGYTDDELLAEIKRRLYRPEEMYESDDD